jgi:hypothetical protein
MVAIAGPAVFAVPAGADTPDGRPSATIEGVVRDVSGAPVADAHVHVETNTSRHGNGYTASVEHDVDAQTDAEGRYRLDDVVLPETRGTEVVFPGQLTVQKPGLTRQGITDIDRRLLDATGVVRADVVLRPIDAVLRGRLSVRGGTPEGGRVTVHEVGVDPGVHHDLGTYGAQADDDGRWRIEVPGGRFTALASSTYGLDTKWPDLPAAWTIDPSFDVSPGATRDGLDLSMRLRQPAAAFDEFGQLFDGWRPPQPGDTVGTYPPDTYRSTTIVRGAVVDAGPPHTSDFTLGWLPKDQLVTTTGLGVPIDVRITNTGDDVLRLGDVRLEGEKLGAFTCLVDNQRPCKGSIALPGRSVIVTVTPFTNAYAPVYHLRLVVPSNASAGDTRVPIDIRNVSDPSANPYDPNNVAALGQFLPPEALALIAANQAAEAAGRPLRFATATELSAAVLRRDRVRVAFPSAGTATVRVDRAVRARPRVRARGVRWATARSVHLRATRSSTRTARIRPLAAGRYRVRLTIRLGTGKARTVSAIRTLRAR